MAKAQQRLLSGEHRRGSKTSTSFHTTPQTVVTSTLSSSSSSSATKVFPPEPHAFTFPTTTTTTTAVMSSTITVPTTSKDTDFMPVSSPNILTVPEPQKLSPLLLSPTFSASSFSGLASPLSSTTSYQTSITSPMEQDIPTSDAQMKVPTKAKVGKPKKDSGKGNKRTQGLLQQEQEKQWKMLQHQRQFEQERQAILKQSKSAGAERQLIHPSARFSATLSSSLVDDLSQQTYTVKPFGAQKVTSPDNFPNRVPNVTSQGPVTPLSKKDDIESIPFLNVSSTKALTSSVTTPTFSVSSLPNKNSAACRYPNAVKTEKGDKIETLESGSQSPDVMDTLLSRANMDRTNQLRNAEQQQAYLLHQQYMAAQQQYIQWQLAQQSSTAAEGMYGPKPYPGKELPEVNSEEQHQERIRFLYQQRQFSKDPASHFIQQPPQTTQARKQETSETGVTPPAIPEPPPALNLSGYPQMPRFSIPTSPEAAIYHQMFLEYMIKFRNNPELDPSSIPASQLYNSMMAEIAKQYYQRHASFSKLIHQHIVQSPHFTVPPRPGLNEDIPTAEKGNIFDTSQDAKLETSSSNLRPPTMSAKDSSAQKTVDGVPVNSKSYNRVHCSSKAVPLPKSASFQISRIAADSTSNDDYNDTDGSISLFSFIFIYISFIYSYLIVFSLVICLFFCNNAPTSTAVHVTTVTANLS